MARTEEVFSLAWSSLERQVKIHNKPFWLVPTSDNYKVSVIKPEPDELPPGTESHLYNAALDIVDTVKSTAVYN